MRKAGGTSFSSLMERRMAAVRVAMVLLLFVTALIGTRWRFGAPERAVLPWLAAYLLIAQLGSSLSARYPRAAFTLCLLEMAAAGGSFAAHGSFDLLLYLAAGAAGARLRIRRQMVVVAFGAALAAIPDLRAPNLSVDMLVDVGTRWAFLFVTSFVIHSVVHGERAQRQQAIQATTLHAIGRAMSRSLDRTEILDSLLRGVETLYPESWCAVYLATDTGLRLGAASRPLARAVAELSLDGDGLAARAYREGMSVIIPDLTADPELQVLSPDGSRLQAMAGVLSGKRAPGVIIVATADSPPLTSEDLQLMETIASQAASALANCVLYREALERSEILERFYAFGQALDRADSAKSVVAAATRHALLLGEAHTCIGLLPDIDGDHFYCAGGEGKLFPANNGLVLHISEPVLARVLQDCEAVEGGTAELGLELAGPGSRCCLVPLINERLPVGALLLLREPDQHFSDAERQLLFSLSRQAAISLHSVQLYEEARARAITDGLTGLYNHRHFHERLHEELARAERYSLQLSLIMIDVDDFKRLNDQEGHPRGDVVLQAVATLLRSFARSTDVVARYGGEEFAIIVLEADQEQAVALAERIRGAMRRMTVVADRPLRQRLTLSQGVASYPAHTDNASRLIEMADQALSRAKRLGKDTVVCTRTRSRSATA